jgi:hypothetical protein
VCLGIRVVEQDDPALGDLLDSRLCASPTFLPVDENQIELLRLEFDDSGIVRIIDVGDME